MNRISSRGRKDVGHFLHLSRQRKRLLKDPEDHNKEKSIIICKNLDILVGEIKVYASGCDRELYTGLMSVGGGI